MLIVLFLIYYWRQNLPLLSRKASIVYVETTKPNISPKKRQITDKKFIYCTNPHVLSNSNEIYPNKNGFNNSRNSVAIVVG